MTVDLAELRKLQWRFERPSDPKAAALILAAAEELERTRAQLAAAEQLMFVTAAKLRLPSPNKVGLIRRLEKFVVSLDGKYADLLRDDA